MQRNRSKFILLRRNINTDKQLQLKKLNNLHFPSPAHRIVYSSRNDVVLLYHKQFEILLLVYSGILQSKQILTVNNILSKVLDQHENQISLSIADGIKI